MSYSQQNQLARASLLQQQRRHADAVRELRQVLVHDPHDAMAHAMLAISHLELDQDKEATAAAQQAVGLAPDLAFAHYALAHALLKRNWLDEAQAAAQEAVRLESYNANHFALLSAIEMERRNWPAALEEAENALAIDPDNDWATNLRAMALVKLGRRAEAAQTMGDALARDPENAYSHANQGWTLLHRGDHRAARVHFREALRLDPTMDWARAGMVESLKSGFWPYKMLLLFWLWMARLSGKAQWGVILGAWVGYQVIKTIARENPAAATFLVPVMVLYVVFVLSTWLAYPLLNLMLRLHRDGRYALSREQVVQSNVIGLLLAAALVAVGAFFWSERVEFVMLAAVSGLLMIPTSGTFNCPAGWPRNVMLAGTIFLALLGLAGVGMAAFAADQKAGAPLLGLFALGILASQFAANGLRMAQPRT